MKKKSEDQLLGSLKVMRIMKITILFLSIGIFHASATSYAQNQRISVKVEKGTFYDVISQIEQQSEFMFFYNSDDIDNNRQISIHAKDKLVTDILNEITGKNDLTYKISGKHIILTKVSAIGQQQDKRQITGKVMDELGEPLIGVNVVEKGTTNGAITDIDGVFSLTVGGNSTLWISYIGYLAIDAPVKGKTSFNFFLKEDTQRLDEVVVVGYGSMKKSDLTGSVVRADIESFKASAGTSILSSLQGSVPGLTVGQTTGAGQQASLLIRGQSTISGETRPLIVVDGVIFRGNLVDLNPSDIASVDVLKDASAAAIYGSQATNGVIIFTTLRGKGTEGKPVINFSGSYSFQSPTKKMASSAGEYYKMMDANKYLNSRTKESGYTEPNPSWSPTQYMVSNQEIQAYEAGHTTNWYDLCTNDNMYLQNYNVSITNSTKYSDLMASLGYTDQAGYMANESFSRINARINFDTKIADWFTVGAQTFLTSSDYSGQSPNPSMRYVDPYAPCWDADGKKYDTVVDGRNNPLNTIDNDNLDKRLSLFGNVYAEIRIPFVKGLSYRVNYANNYQTNSYYVFEKSPENSFKGAASKDESIRYDWSVDNIISYKQTFKEKHKIDLTLVSGVEKITYNYTRAGSSKFASDQLGYNKLEAGDASLQTAASDAWEESSLYSMMRLNYSFNSRYLFTGTVRRDGFSGFSEKNKFGVFPSISVAWVFSEESFFKKPAWLEYLKFRASYGSVGNRTIGRYATMARIEAGYSYITYDGVAQYTQEISSLASPNLKWETTTGINLGADFSFLKGRISGYLEYYNNNTTNLLYNVDIPLITRYSKFPDNLGKLNNHGLELKISTINIKSRDFEWNTSFNFSRDRNKLVSLLGIDNNNDGIEDDLVSEGLFIGKSIDAIYAYKIDGIWQLDDKVPVGYEIGSYKVVDLNGDGKYSPEDDRTIIGYRTPSFRFSISNNLMYKNWNLFFFINSCQGGKNRYLGQDHIFYSTGGADQLRKVCFPEGFDYWSPTNKDAFYQKPESNSSGGLAGVRYSQRNFIRLQDVSLSYNFPKNWLSKMKIANLKLYVSGKNLLTITNWNGWDPETGETITEGGVPVVKSYTMGIELKF